MSEQLIYLLLTGFIGTVLGFLIAYVIQKNKTSEVEREKASLLERTSILEEHKINAEQVSEELKTSLQNIQSEKDTLKERNNTLTEYKANADKALEELKHELKFLQSKKE